MLPVSQHGRMSQKGLSSFKGLQKNVDENISWILTSKNTDKELEFVCISCETWKVEALTWPQCKHITSLEWQSSYTSRWDNLMNIEKRWKFVCTFYENLKVQGFSSVLVLHNTSIEGQSSYIWDIHTSIDKKLKLKFVCTFYKNFKLWGLSSALAVHITSLEWQKLDICRL